MSIMVYFAIGALLAFFTLNMDNVRLALPALYESYKGETEVADQTVMSRGTFDKGMILGLLLIYAFMWPIIVIKIIVQFFGGGRGGGGSGKLASA